jgi:NitT/TauT family transport system permease protein
MKPIQRYLLPVGCGLVLLAVWWILCLAHAFPKATVPTPPEVARAFWGELVSGRLADDIVASLYRVGFGYVLAVIVAVPLGLVIGRSLGARAALLPWVNFFRCLSPIAWIPFAILWFGIGDLPAIFIIFIATFFQIVLATAAAAASVPRIFYRVAEDLGMPRGMQLVKVTFPAILPQLILSLRVAIGVAWMVVVVAEMMAVRSGLGFLISDARNALRMDLIVVGMISIGAIGISLDILFAQLAKVPSVRWGFDR